MIENGGDEEDLAVNGVETEEEAKSEVDIIKQRLDRLESNQGELKDTVNDIKSKFETGSVSPTKKVPNPGSNDIVGPSMPMSQLRAMFGN